MISSRFLWLTRLFRLTFFSKMRVLGAVSLVLALSPLLSWAVSLPQETHPVDTYVPLNTYEAFESPPPEDTLRTLSTALNITPADLYFLSVFHTYNTLPASEKAALAAQRDLNRTIDDEINLCLWTIPGDCWPLWINGHRREIKLGWSAFRKSGEKDYDQRMEYVVKGEEVAARWARIVQGMQERWRAAKVDVSACAAVGEVWNQELSQCDPSEAVAVKDADA
jgi:hypothetical protein